MKAVKQLKSPFKYLLKLFNDEEYLCMLIDWNAFKEYLGTVKEKVAKDILTKMNKSNFKNHNEFKKFVNYLKSEKDKYRNKSNHDEKFGDMLRTYWKLFDNYSVGYEEYQKNPQKSKFHPTFLPYSDKK